NTSEKEVVRYKTEVIKTSAMKKGEKKIIKKGSNGVLQINKEFVYKGEELRETNLNSKRVIKKPINEVVIQGVDSTVPILMVPTKGVYSSYFGARWGKVHKGVDIAACVGTPVGAAEGGVVTFSGDRGTYGKCVIIQHKSGYETLYAHNSKLVAKQGQVVYKGQVISHTGNTGRSTGPHLHFEVKKDGTAIDPIKLINK
ncbi:MAG: M23 family metallopeptidase, partial [Clostridium sp.]